MSVPNEPQKIPHTIEWPSILSRDRPLTHGKFSWRFTSRFVVPAVGILSKLWTDYANKTQIHNHDVFLETIAKHYKNKAKRALITVSNHSSCMDDPLIWGALIPFKWHLNSHRLRWSAAAQEICFTKDWHSTFFALGKTFPIVRGRGIYQPAMDFALDLLKEGQWLHIFPQGKVIPENDRKCDSAPVKEVIDSTELNKYQLKWGMARLILDHVFNKESSGVIEVLPLYHLGMDDLLPNQRPYIPRINKRVTFYIRDDGPIYIDKNYLFDSIKNFSSLNAKSKRIKIMEMFDHEMNILKAKALRLHNIVDVIS